MLRGGKQKKKRGVRGGVKLTNPSGSVQQYNGPMRIPLAAIQEETTSVEMTLITPITSTVGAVVNNVIALSLSSFNQAASFQAVWDEYRVLAATNVFVPNLEHGQCFTTPILYAPLAMVIDRDSNAALTTLQQAASFGSCHIKSIASEIHINYRMSGSEDAQWFGTAVVTPAWVKMLAGGLSSSTNYGIVYTRAIVQFRGRVA